MKLLLVVSIMFLVLVVSGCTNTVDDNNVNLPDFEECQRTENYRFRASCFGKISGQLQSISSQIKDPDICLEYNSTEGIDWCYRELAYIKMNSDICNQITNINEKDACIEKIAINTFNVDLCSELADKNVNSCIVEAIWRADEDELIQLLNEEPDFCSRLVDYATYPCYLNSAIAKKDITICEKISDIDNKLNCRDQVFLRISKDLKDTEICNNIISNYTRDRCYNPNVNFD